MSDDPIAEQARRRAAVLEGKPYRVPDDAAEGAEDADGEAVATRPAEPRPRRRRNGRGRFASVLEQPVEPRVSAAEPVGRDGSRRVVLVADDVVVVRLSEVAEVLNRGGDPMVLGVSMGEAVGALSTAGWTSVWTAPVDG